MQYQQTPPIRRLRDLKGVGLEGVSIEEVYADNALSATPHEGWLVVVLLSNKCFAIIRVVFGEDSKPVEIHRFSLCPTFDQLLRDKPNNDGVVEPPKLFYPESGEGGVRAVLTLIPGISITSYARF
ncbi:hypothetical protein KC845_02965 [Candidatus Kaiserbacteria bacterium]|nr:hypothetical protein [Candidatus Kaiserbacteria bacterium]